MSSPAWALPAALAAAGIGALAVTAVALLMSSRRRAAEQNATAEERAELALQRRLAVTALGIGCLMMFVLAGIAAWLSFGAQREYAHAHNGGDWDAATGFALLLDAGALSLSLIRFFEALTLRSSAITRILLLAFVCASAAMNLLHGIEQVHAVCADQRVIGSLARKRSHSQPQASLHRVLVVPRKVLCHPLLQCSDKVAGNTVVGGVVVRLVVAYPNREGRPCESHGP
ncbi:DUF2637 domain-containing protein [Streptomyces sp. NPDC056716]|uniref:DUF2637 domain-containing protein n=1 Tax=unclassified Streptomyces TaxID=2593676 RepID=UPI0036BAF3C4